MRARLLLPAGALALAGCALFPDFDVLQEQDGSDASIPSDGAPFDALIGDASVGADTASEASVTTDGGDAAADSGERVQDNTTIFCGPALECSRADPNNGCCVSSADAGSPPTSYVYTCEDSSKCDFGGNQPFIACDQGSDCAGTNQVCCWPSAVYPLRTFCFAADAGNCAIELCDPNDAVPCVNHAGDQCVPSGSNVPNGKTTPLGYFVCIAP